MNRFRCVLIIAALAIPGLALAADETKKVTTVEGITEYSLPNGLRFLLYPDPSAQNVTVNMTVLVGSRHEGYGESGMAHLLEHMVFKGTPTNKNIPKALKDHGARFNGTTNTDRTNYFETMEGTDANLEFGIALEADRLVNSFIAREDLASEMTVVRSEFEIGENNPIGMLFQRMLAASYEWHNYGKSTIGNRSDIERVPIENLQAFYKKYYQPDNIVLIVAGKFDEKKALALIEKYFGPLKKPERKLDKTYTEEPAQDGEHLVTLRRVGKGAAVGAMYHIPAGSHEDFAAVEVLATLLTQEPSGPLYKALVESKKASGVFAMSANWHDPGVLVVMAQVESEKGIDAARDTMTEVLEKLGKEKIGDEEVERARTRLLNQRELLMKDANRVGTTLSEWVSKGDWRLFFLHRDRLEKVTAADVQRVAEKYLQRSNRTLGVFIPSEQVARTPVPESPDVAKLVKDYQGRKAVAAGESFDPTPENIEKRVQRSELPGGVKVALLPKKSRGELVVLRLALRFGNADSLKGQVTAADFLGVMMRKGTAHHTRQQLEDELNRLKATISASSDAGEVNFTVQCERENLPAVLKLLGEIVREPSFPQTEFDILKRQEKDGLTRNLTEPGPLAQNALDRKLNPYPADDVRYKPTLEEELARVDKVTLDDVKKLYADQVGGTAGELVVVGDFEPATVTKAVGDMLKDWKSKTPYKRIEEKAFTDVKGERMVIDTPDKANAVFRAGLSLAMNDADPDYQALRLADYMLGSDTLSSRLGNRIRQKEGLSYGARSQLSVDSLDKSGTFSISVNHNPNVKDKVDKAVAEEVALMLKDGVSAKELDEAKKSFLQAQKVGRSSDGALAGLLQNWLRTDRTAAFLAESEKKIAALTPEQVNEAFRKHVSANKLVIIQAGDFKKK
jgi:zinc protease